MRYRFNRGYRYRLTNPPKALLNARLDNIAIVPASMLPLTPLLKEKAAISGGFLSAVISMRYILGFRKDNPNVFNTLVQNLSHC